MCLQFASAAPLPRVKAELTFAPHVPPPITRPQPAIVEVDLRAERKVMRLTPWTDYNFWTFNDHVPGPFIRARVGDWLEVHLTDADTNGMPHNVDFHAVTGPGGGAPALTAVPGTPRTGWFRLRYPGLFVYHCSVPPMMDHIANGMYGMILVEPTNGLPHVDQEFCVMQSEFYTMEAPANATVLEFSHQRGLDEHPSYVVFNGRVAAVMLQNALHVETGERVRIYFGNAGPNLISSFHVIGTVLENVYRDGGLSDPPGHGLQTAFVPPGGGTIVEFTPVVPGTYEFVDHAMFRVDKGAMGEIEVSGEPKMDVYRTEEQGPPKDLRADAEWKGGGGWHTAALSPTEALCRPGASANRLMAGQSGQK